MKDHYEILHPIRRKAGKWLIRLKLLYSIDINKIQQRDTCCNSELETTYKQLIALRYGNKLNWTNSKNVFKRSKQLLKKHKTRFQKSQ